jgi:hypothetical protein
MQKEDFMFLLSSIFSEEYLFCYRPVLFEKLCKEGDIEKESKDSNERITTSGKNAVRHEKETEEKIHFSHGLRRRKV